MHPPPDDDSGHSLLRPYFRAGAGGDRAPAGPADPGPVGALRPFLLTEGRVADAGTIPVETQVVATDQGRAAVPGRRAEHRDIIELCSVPLSVAEISAHLGLHLGVVRILVEDLSRAGDVRAYLPHAAAPVDETVLRQLISGLRALR